MSKPLRVVWLESRSTWPGCLGSTWHFAQTPTSFCESRASSVQSIDRWYQVKLIFGWSVNNSYATWWLNWCIKLKLNRRYSCDVVLARWIFSNQHSYWKREPIYVGLWHVKTKVKRTKGLDQWNSWQMLYFVWHTTFGFIKFQGRDTQNYIYKNHKYIYIKGVRM